MGGRDVGLPRPEETMAWTLRDGEADTVVKGPALDFFQEWMEFRTQRPRGEAMTILFASTTQGWWAAGYINYLWEQGLRGNQVTKEVNALRLSFERMGWSGCLCWDTMPVKVALATVGRSVVEMRSHMGHRIRMEKFDMNFEAMFTLRGKLVPSEEIWESQPTKEEADAALLYLLAYALFDLGVRGGNLADTGKGGTGMAGERVDKGSEKAEVAEHEKGPGEVWTPREEERYVSRRHETQWRDWTYFFREAEGSLKPVLGHQLSGYWRQYPEAWPERGEVIFPTSKTAGKGKNGGVVVQPVKFGRASPVEKAEFNLMLGFLRWSGCEDPDLPVFFRKPIPEMGCRGEVPGKHRRIRISDLANELKKLAISVGIGHNHLSPISFRKGHVSTCAALGRWEEGKRLEEEMRRMKFRSGQWTANSRVPQTNYLHTGAVVGPFARVSSWAEAVKVGGGFEAWIERQGAEEGVDLDTQRAWTKR